MLATTAKIQSLGFEWPRYPEIEECCASILGVVDLAKTLERLESKLAFYEKEIEQMYAFARQWNAPIEEITDNRETYGDARIAHQHAIAHVKDVIAALELG